VELPRQYFFAKRWLVEWSGVDDLGLHLMAGMLLFALCRFLLDAPRWFAVASAILVGAINEVVDAMHVVLRVEAIGEDFLATAVGACLALTVSVFLPNRLRWRIKKLKAFARLRSAVATRRSCRS
jgi:hypothetical protein